MTTTKAPASKTTTKATTAKRTPAKKTSTKATAPVHPGTTWAALLAEKSLSQSEAARQMGVAGMSLNRLVNGKGLPTAAMTVKFAAITGADVHALWTEVAAFELATVLADTK